MDLTKGIVCAITYIIMGVVRRICGAILASPEGDIAERVNNRRFTDSNGKKRISKTSDKLLNSACRLFSFQG